MVIVAQKSADGQLELTMRVAFRPFSPVAADAAEALFTFFDSVETLVTRERRDMAIDLWRSVRG